MLYQQICDVLHILSWHPQANDPIVDIVRGLCRQGQCAGAEKEAMRLLSVAIDNGNGPRQGVALTLLATVYHLKDELPKACQRYNETITVFQLNFDQLGEAIASYGLATVYESLGKWHEVLNRYEESSELFEQLRDRARRLGDTAKLKYYHSVIDLIASREKRARIEHERQCKREQGPQSFVPILPDLPAGDLMANPENDEIVGYVSADAIRKDQQIVIEPNRFQIDDLPNYRYHVPSKLSPDYYYALARVSGNSMNHTRIRDGDYLLLRQPTAVQLVPQDRDIVATVIVEYPDSFRVVRRYRKRNGQVDLLSESNEPGHASYFAISDQQLRIVAVVIAVLRRI